MTLKLTTRDSGDVVIVDARGKLTLGAGTSALREKMRELAQLGARRVVLNLADVSYVDSSGVGELVAAKGTVGKAGGEMKLLNLTKRAHDLLKLMKLCTVFETYGDEVSAIGSFSTASRTELQLRWDRFWRRITADCHIR
jgi:anti-sigma B factor antagonist